jgi:stage III sporulation protein AG
LREKIEKILKNKTYLILILGSVGIFLIFISSFSFPEKTTDEIDYRYETEERLRQMIESVEGAGKTKVMITLKNSGEQIYKETRKVFSSGEYRDEVVIVNGKNGNEALTSEVRYPEIEGVLVVCVGGDNINVKEEIMKLISAVYSIGRNNIYVSKLSE